jgi:hypothetical protein
VKKRTAGTERKAEKFFVSDEGLTVKFDAQLNEEYDGGLGNVFARDAFRASETGGGF